MQKITLYLFLVYTQIDYLCNKQITIVNTPDFIERLSKILQFYDMSASNFADKIGVQRSSISHLLSGRNKPSLEFILKVDTSFSEVDLNWLLYGKGTFPKKIEKSPIADSPKSNTQINPSLEKINLQKKSIDKVIIFYTDGSFEAYS